MTGETNMVHSSNIKYLSPKKLLPEAETREKHNKISDHGTRHTNNHSNTINAMKKSNCGIEDAMRTQKKKCNTLPANVWNIES